MAVAAAVAKEGIEKELTCPLCLDIFGEPKKLPCDHIYCKEPCLKGLLLRSLNGAITCPECRTVVQVPQNDLNKLPTAFRINRLKEVFEAMQQKEETDSQAVKQSEQATCTTHKSQPLAIYCETCEEVLCRDCLLKSDKHKDHHHGFIEEVAEKQREAVMKHVETARNLEINLSSAIEQISHERLKVSTQGQSHLDQLNARFEATIRALKREKEQVEAAISRDVRCKTATLASQEEKLTTCLSKLSDTIKRVEDKAQSDGQNVIQELQDACKKVKQLSLQPAAKVDHGRYFTSSEEIVACYMEGNCQYPLADPEKCLLESFETLQTGKECTAALQLRDYVGNTCTYLLPQDIQVELQSIRDSQKVIQGSGKQLGKGIYAITVTPQSRGRHFLSVKIDNTHISGSPFSVFVQITPQQLDWPIGTVPGIYHPVGLTCFDDKLYVIDDYQLLLINENLKIVQSHELDPANKINIDAETTEWFATDTEHHQLHKYNKHNSCIKSVGSKGRGRNQFDHPNGLQVSRSGELFVCDSRNHRIKVYNKELELQRILGKVGVKKGHFNTPDSLAIDETGNIYVTESSNHRVQALTSDGKTICTIGQPGGKPGELDGPAGIAISGQYIYIADSGNKRISVFTTQGEFITSFGSVFLRKPECIAIDRDGYVYVSDNNEKVFQF